jgi:hypothetical protein
MSSLIFRFKSWRPFGAVLDSRPISRFLDEAGDESKRAFQKGNRAAKSGKTYYGRSKRTIRASAANEYPAMDTGDLDASIKVRRSPFSVTIGTTVWYAKFLRYGTRKMARRKMSDSALQEGVAKSRKHLKGFVKWRRL